MTLIKGFNNPGYYANVDDKGRIEAHSVGITEQAATALNGNSYNFNTSTITFGTANETPVFYISNIGESRPIIIPRVFITFGASTGGTGEISGKIYYNPTGGDILTAQTKDPQNFNAGSSKTLQVDSRIGADGVTFSGGTDPVEFLFPGASSRWLVGFETIVLPRGSSMLLTITPPTGNTSMVLQAGCNIYLSQKIETNV